MPRALLRDLQAKQSGSPEAERPAMSAGSREPSLVQRGPQPPQGPAVQAQQMEPQQAVHVRPQEPRQTLLAARSSVSRDVVRPELPRVSGKLSRRSAKARQLRWRRSLPDAPTLRAHPATAAQSPDPPAVGWRSPATVAGPQYSPPGGEEEQCAEAPGLLRAVIRPGWATLTSSAPWAGGAH